jgi:hypothetical protein
MQRLSKHYPAESNLHWAGYPFPLPGPARRPLQAGVSMMSRAGDQVWVGDFDATDSLKMPISAIILESIIH